MTMGVIPIIPIILLIWLGLVSGCKVNMFFKSLKNAVEELFRLAFKTEIK